MCAAYLTARYFGGPRTISVGTYSVRSGLRLIVSLTRLNAVYSLDCLVFTLVFVEYSYLVSEQK